MRILVCFKIVRDLDTVLEADWKNVGNGSFEIDYTKKMLNCFDESALETALCVAETLGEGAEAHALTVTDQNVEQFLKNLYAIGYTNVTQIKCGAELGFRPRTVASLIASFAKAKGGFDAIFMGYQSSVGDHSVTPFVTAELLGIPCVNMVTDVEAAGGGLTVSSIVDSGIRKARVLGPAVFAFTNARHTYLRVATLREKMAAKSREIETTDMTVPDIRENSVSGFIRENSSRAGRMLEGQDAAGKTKALYDTYIKKAVEE